MFSLFPSKRQPKGKERISQPRPKIPEELKRRVRQHCGFACAICGEMPTDVEHIEPYSQVQQHEFENLVLLCVRHHREVTSKRISKNAVRNARERPFSKKNNKAVYGLFMEDRRIFRMGSQIVRLPQGAPFHLIHGGTHTPFSVRFDDIPLFSIDIRDRNGNPAISMTDNVFNFTPSNLWDVRLTGQKLSVRTARGKYLLKVEISDGNLHLRYARVVVDDTPIILTEEMIRFPNQDIEIQGGSLTNNTQSEMAYVSLWASTLPSAVHLDARPSKSSKDAWKKLF